MVKSNSPARAWYGGKASPDESVLDLVEAGDIQPLYAHCDGEATGDSADRVRMLREKLCDVSRFAEWSPTRGLQVLLTALVDYAHTLRERAIALEFLGRYAFDPAATAEEKKALLQAALAPTEAELDQQAQRLGEIWKPAPGGVLDLIVNRPAHMGQLLADRLDPIESPPLEVVGFGFEGLDPEAKRALVQSQTAAYERDGTVYMLLPLLDALKGWEPSSHHGAQSQLTLWDMLFIHELTEMVLEETLELELLPAHIVASTLERLFDDTLGMVVESYFLEMQRREVEADGEPAEGGRGSRCGGPTAGPFCGI